MPQNWKTYKLGGISSTITYGYTESASTEEIGPKFLRITDIQNSFISWNNVPYCPISNKDFEKYKLEIGDIVIARTGNSTGANAIIKDEINAVYASYLIRYQIDKNKADPTFVAYNLRSKKWFDYVDAIKGGSAQPGANAQQFAQFELTLPPLQEQTAIASILSALDDKIEINLQQNKTIEEMAMALYKHWFVDFGPFKEGKFIDSELGRIPEDWEVKRLGDFSTIIMGQSPKSEFYNSERTGLPFHQGVKDFGERFPTDITYTTSGNKIAEEGEILFSVRAPVGRINIAKNKIVLGRGLASLKMKDGNGFLLYSLKNFFQKEDIIGSGTVFNSVNKTEIENIKFVKPNRELLIEFNQKITGIDELIYSNYLENENLKNQRDSLLPKLINGDKRISI